MFGPRRMLLVGAFYGAGHAWQRPGGDRARRLEAQLAPRVARPPRDLCKPGLGPLPPGDGRPEVTTHLLLPLGAAVAPRAAFPRACQSREDVSNVNGENTDNIYNLRIEKIRAKLIRYHTKLLWTQDRPRASQRTEAAAAPKAYAKIDDKRFKTHLE